MPKEPEPSLCLAFAESFTESFTESLTEASRATKFVALTTRSHGEVMIAARWHPWRAAAKSPGVGAVAAKLL